MPGDNEDKPLGPNVGAEVDAVSATVLVDVGSAPTIAPATPGPPAAAGPHGPLAVGSGAPNPDSTLDMPVGEQGAIDQNQIGHFRVVRRLGMGGMGVVFACVDANLNRQVAVKLVRDENAAYRARLLREAQAMARLEHPNVVRIYEVGTDRGRMFIAMELVDGETLTSWLRSFRTWQDIVDMFVQVGAGLAAVHGVGLVHRDFKPDNVLIDRNGRARVADFGLARLDAPGDASPIGQPLTTSGVVMGTPGYMAPEQHFGADVDARADQYSFCIAMREALGGRPVDETRWKKVPEPVRIVVNRGLAYDPADRYPTMKELLKALPAAAAPAATTYVIPGSAPDAATVTPVDARKTEPRWAIALLVLAVLGIVAGVIAFVGTRKSHTAVALRNDAGARLAVTPSDAAAVAEIAPGPLPPSPIPPSPLPPPPPSPTQLPLDAGLQVAHVTATHPSPTARRDAGIDAAAQIAATANSQGAPPPGTLPTMSPSPAWGPYSAAWQNAKGGKVDVIRAAVASVGYDGFDASWTKDSLEKTISSTEGAERGIAQAQLGMLLRKKGDCAGASAQFVDAIKALPAWEPKDQATWRHRAGMGRTLCTLAAGKIDDALEQVLAAGSDGAAIQLVRGITSFEKGDKPLAYAQLGIAYKDPSTKAATTTYLDGQGLKLGP